MLEADPVTYKLFTIFLRKGHEILYVKIFHVFCDVLVKIDFYQLAAYTIGRLCAWPTDLFFEIEITKLFSLMGG